MRKTIASLLFLLALLPIPVAVRTLWAHGEGVLKADRASMAAGDSLHLTGSHFEPGATYRLRLAGALQEFPLATARADAKGLFALTVGIPAAAREGSYRLQAVGPDDDVDAALDVAVLATAPVPGHASTEPMRPMSGMGSMPTAAEMPIARQQGGAAWGLIGGVIGLTAGMGLGLLLRRKVAVE